MDGWEAKVAMLRIAEEYEILLGGPKTGLWGVYQCQTEALYNEIGGQSA
jgi:hypothetical protein